MPLVSIIMPAYNAAEYISEAIESVLAQSHKDWELLVINDGSQDNTEEKVLAFDDSRIRYFIQENRGVSAARNVGLDKMQGDFFCFLDADDAYPPNSLAARLELLEKDPKVDFVDGKVEIRDAQLQKVERVWTPDFEGNPKRALIRLNDKCFFGPSWMIRIKHEQPYQMQVRMTHAEDLLFYISISASGNYAWTSEVVLHYRNDGHSAMANLRGLENGYNELYQIIKAKQWGQPDDWLYLRRRIRRIMFASYLRKGKIWAALRSFFRFTF